MKPRPRPKTKLPKLVEIVADMYPHLLFVTLEDMARYAGLLLALAEDFGLQARLFFGQKKELIMLFWPTLAKFWCPVVPLVTLSSNLSNFEKNP